MFVSVGKKGTHLTTAAFSNFIDDPKHLETVTATTIANAVAASCAAPTYFPQVTIGKCFITDQFFSQTTETAQ